MPRILTIDEVKPLIGNLATNNYYELQFGGLSLSLSSYLLRRGVDRTFTGGDFGLMAYDAQLPGTSLADIQSNNFQGVTENFAYQKAYQDLTISFYCDSEYRGLKFMEHWMEYVVSGNGTSAFNNYASSGYSYRLRYPEEYKSNQTTLVKFDRNVQKYYEYSFIGLFPKSISPTPVSYGAKGGQLGNILKINCTFKYDRFIAGSIYSIDEYRGISNNLISNISNTFTDVVDIARTLVNQ